MPEPAECCHEQPRLCIDAQFFVPASEIDLCYATYINFTGTNPLKHIVPVDNLQTTGIDESIISSVPGSHIVYIDLVFGANNTKIGKLGLKYIISGTVNPTFAWASGSSMIYSIEGYNVVPNNTVTTGTGVFAGDVVAVDSNCVADLIYFNGNLIATRNATINSNIIYITMPGNVKIYTITPLASPVAGTAWSTVIPIGVASDYQPTTTLGDPISSGIINMSSTVPDNTVLLSQAQNIAAAALSLQFRVNDNMLTNGDDCDSNDQWLPTGMYDVCISYKSCEAKWENYNILRLEKKLVRCNSVNSIVIKAYWGCDTNKHGKELCLHHESAKIGDTVPITVCGTFKDLICNKNDVVVYIDQIMQAFSIVDTLVVPTSNTIGPKPYPEKYVKFTNDANIKPYLKASLANSKLYLSLNYIALIPNEHDFCNSPNQCCKGQLNPWKSYCDKDENKKIKYYEHFEEFITKEIVHMQDHPLHNSHLAREIKICLAGECM